MRVLILNPSSLNAVLCWLLPDREDGGPGKIEKLCEELIEHGCGTPTDVKNLLTSNHSGFQNLEKGWPPMEGSRYDQVGVTRLSLAISNREYRESYPKLDKTVPYERYTSANLPSA